MKLESLTKDELIHIIRQKALINMDDLEFSVLSYRAQQRIQEAEKCSKEAGELLRQYIELMRPYEGKPLASVPDDIVKKASAALTKREKLHKQEHRKEMEYRAIQKRMDELLGL